MQEKEKNFISAVIYVRNCAGAISYFAGTVADTIETCFEKGEIIFVDDASDDGSVDIIRKTAALHPDVNMAVLHLDSFHGREAAMQGGVGLAIGDFVFEFDHPYDKLKKSDLIKVYETSKSGADIVSAVSSGSKRMSSGLFYSVFNKNADLSVPLESECYRILSRRAINRVYSQNNIIPYRKVAYATCGLNRAQVEIDEGPGINDGRKSKKARRELATDSLLMFTNVGFRISLGFTVAMMVILLIFVVYAIIIRILGKPIEGWTSTVLLISFGFFGIFGILTVITKYLQLLIRINVKRKVFTYSSIEKLN